MARPTPMGNDRLGPVAEWRRREDGASSFILVQVQAGSPAFARFASYGLAGQPTKIRRRNPNRFVRGEMRACPAAARGASEGGKITVDGPFLGLHGPGIWSKDASRARGLLTLL